MRIGVCFNITAKQDNGENAENMVKLLQHQWKYTSAGPVEFMEWNGEQGIPV